MIKITRKAKVLALSSLLISNTTLAVCKLPLTQDVPELTKIDLGAPGVSHGDILFAEASLRSSGTLVGDLNIMLTTVRLPDNMASGRQSHEERFGNLVYHFGDTDSLVVGGSSLYPINQTEIADNAPQIRAVTGGTGRYKFARGQVITKRKPDGTYEHVFELDGAAKLCRFKTK